MCFASFGCRRGALPCLTNQLLIKRADVVVDVSQLGTVPTLANAAIATGLRLRFRIAVCKKFSFLETCDEGERSVALASPMIGFGLPPDFINPPFGGTERIDAMIGPTMLRKGDIIIVIN